MMRRFVAFGVAVFSSLVSTVAADGQGQAAAERNWGQWRGPLGTGASPTANPPTSWSEGSNVKWKVKLPGAGTASPIIWEKQIFIQSSVATGKKVETAAAASEPTPPPGPPDGKGGGRRGGGMRGVKPSEVLQFVLVCLDRSNGQVLWQKVAREELPHEGHHPDHGFASHSPSTDGQMVFAYFGSRGLHAFDMQGNLKWQKDFGKMETKMDFGEGSSPALHGSKLIVNWDHEGEDFVAALDKTTGKEVWRQKRDEETTWATPLVVTIGGKPQVIIPATQKIRSYDLESGQQLWECGPLTANVIPSPVADDELVYVMSGFRGAALFAIKPNRTGNLADTDAIVWRHNRNTPYVPSPLLFENRLYFFSGNLGVLSSFEAKTGKQMIDAQRIDELQGVYASPVAASGKVYLVGRNGTTVVLKHGDTVEKLSVNRLDEKIDASPALAGRELFLRSHQSLYCISETN